MAPKYNVMVVHDDDYEPSHASWSTHLSTEYHSRASYSTTPSATSSLGEDHSDEEARCYDAEDHSVKLQKRTNYHGQVVTVVNYGNARTKEDDGPHPGYGKPRDKIKEDRDHKKGHEAKKEKKVQKGQKDKKDKKDKKEKH